MTLRTVLPVAALAALLGTACATESAVEDHWGESYRTLTAAQIENPEAGDDRPVEGLGATSADHVTDRYHERRATSHQDDRMQRSTLQALE